METVVEIEVHTSIVDVSGGGTTGHQSEGTSARGRALGSPHRVSCSRSGGKGADTRGLRRMRGVWTEVRRRDRWYGSGSGPGGGGGLLRCPPPPQELRIT